jgi:hypothetical protein
MNLRITTLVLVLLSFTLAACGGSSSPAPTDPSAASQGAAVKPQSAAAREHFAKHVNYPASRSTILAACANTNEFSDSEKRWFEQKLPEREYKSADEVIVVLGL